MGDRSNGIRLYISQAEAVMREIDSRGTCFSRREYVALKYGESRERGCKIFCVYGNETFQIRIRYVVVFVGFCSRIFCRIYLSGYSISCPLSFIHAF